MDGVRRALETELQVEREFVGGARRSETAPKGWPAALLMFHVSMWRELLRNALRDVSEGRPHTPPPVSADDFNDMELANGIGTPLTDAAARSEILLNEIIELYGSLGEREFPWYSGRTTTEAVLRVSYVHPRGHFCEYLSENGDLLAGVKLLEDAVTDLRKLEAPPNVLGAAVYNLGLARAAQEKPDEAIALLEEALTMRPDLKKSAAGDAHFAPLREDVRFQNLIK